MEIDHLMLCLTLVKTIVVSEVLVMQIHSRQQRFSVVLSMGGQNTYFAHDVSFGWAIR